MDLRKLSVGELEQLIDRATKRKQSLSQDRVKRVRARIDALLKAEGLTLGQVYGGMLAKTAPAASLTAPVPRDKRGDKRGKVKPKYRNPDDPTQTWAGRGAQPRWMAAALSGGRTLDDLLIR
jgi:DNA-binding protein H-NS